jgi:tricorn protease
MTQHRTSAAAHARDAAALPALALALLAVVAAAAPVAAESPEGYYRFPALRGDTVVFTAEGDLWTAPVAGGAARRLTTHAGEETHAAISPDGATVAFSASYDGPTEVYTMPLAGGVPVRRTWEAELSEVSGFTPDGRLVYVTQHFATLPDPHLVLLDLETGNREIVPLAQASDACWTADGSTLVFARPYWNRNNTKRYQGGTARNLWRFAAGDPEAANLTADLLGESHSPMMWRDGAGVERVVYVNDRDGFMNLWSMTLDGGDRRQHTRHVDWDVRDPAIDGSRVIYRLGADLRLHDLATGADAKIPIRIASDFDQLRERWVQDPLEYLTSVEIHPRGESLVLTARGRVFVVPAKAGRTVQLERKAGVRYRDAVFMPDGDQVVLLSDETGELELRLVPADGIGEGRALTDDGDILRFGSAPSPDGRFIAHADKNYDLFVLEIATGARRRLNDNREGVGGLAWSPDSKWMVWERTAPNTFRQLMLYSVEADSSEALTSDRVNSVSAAWSQSGEWLYFLSDRNLESVVGQPWGARQPDPHIDSSWKLYQMSMKRGLRPAFRPADELHARQKKEEKEEKEKPDESRNGSQAAAGNGKDDGKNGEKTGEGDEAEGEVQTVVVDRDGIQQRYWEIPVEPGNYSGLAAGDGALYWVSRQGAGFAGEASLLGLEIEADLEGDRAKPETVASGIRAYALSADRKKLMVRQGTTFSIVDAKPAKADLTEGKVDLAGFKFPLSQREDYRQLFVDAWRLERDYFYDPGMHGLDWEAVRDRYLPLVDRVTSRAELSDLIGELVSELSALHVSVRGGDLRAGPEQIGLGRLGARVRRDRAAGGDVIERIYRHDPDFPEERSPLADPYLGIAEGDVIVAVNGTPVLGVPAIGALLRDQGGEQARLRIRAGADGVERDVIVTLLESEASLRYRDWQVTRREMVEEMGGGDIGYVHLRAMGGGDLTEWYRSFYPVFDRRGLILDVRHNRGGNIDSFLLGKLVRQAWMYWQGRVGRPTWNMQYAFRGHMVVLVDEQTASDGEAFAEGFRRLGLGPVIGTRTWGGEIWLGSSNRLTDMGLARAPETGVYGPEREWLIEGWGVDPDIVVDNLPHETFLGKDRQLEKAIEVLEQKIAKEPRDVPAPPPYPDKSFEAWQERETATASGRSGG